MSETTVDDRVKDIDFWALKEYAQEIHGIKVSAGTSKAEVVSLLETEGEDISKLREKVATMNAGKTTAKKKQGDQKSRAAAKVVLGHTFMPDPIEAFNIIDTIMIYENEKDNKPVYVSVNNRNCYIPRGKEMPIRRPLRQALANAMEESYNPETKEVTRRPRFPFTVMQYDVSGTSPAVEAGVGDSRVGAD